jgi:AcrR family transcriptional regulator
MGEILLLEKRLDYVYTDNMASKANSVNIKKIHEKRGYHHGDLRSALIDTGLRLIENSDAEHLSLREVAREVGVSATAVYRHFPDKQALLYAMCERGARQLGTAQRDAMIGKPAKAAFEAAGRAYILFALANPALYRLMMATKGSVDHYDASGNAMGDAMQLLKDCVASVLPPKASAMEHKIAALHAWSLVHGISMLMLDGLVAPDNAEIDALVMMPLNQI